MDETSELLRLEARRCDAMVAANVDELDILLADQLIWTHSSARQDTKTSLLEALRAGGTRYLHMKRTEERVRVHGDIAVVTGLVAMRASIKGEEKDLLNRYTDVWSKFDGVWRMIAWQSTAAPSVGREPGVGE
jgi:ketosteroid isomerase-like protein